MSKSLFKYRYNSQNKAHNWLSITNTQNNKRFVSDVTNPGYVDLSWLKNILERLNNFSSVPTFVYQLVALGLLTLGFLLTFQNFSNTATTDNPIAQAKFEIAKTEEKRIWTNTNSIDSLNTSLNYTFAVAAPVVSNSPEDCTSVDLVKSQSSNTNNECKAEDKIKQPTKPTTLITVESGDTISLIAKQNNTTTSSIVELNSLSSNKIKVGQKLLVELPEANQSKTSVKTNKVK
jgi:LysM repeat protein